MPFRTCVFLGPNCRKLIGSEAGLIIVPVLYANSSASRTRFNDIVAKKEINDKTLRRKVTKALEQSEKKADDVGKNTEEMEGEAHLFFQERTNNLEGISNEDLQRLIRCSLQLTTSPR